jgi:UDP-2,3-diacylglucosamine hydrolase
LARLTLISDLHLCAGVSSISDSLALLVNRLVKRQASKQSQTLYIIGDLFSFWVDRPLLAKLFAPALNSLRNLTDSGCQVVILDGNRDFGLGKILSKNTGAETAGESLKIEHAGQSILLLHGDQLLTADRRYQIFKSIIRSLPVRLIAKLLPSPLLRWGINRLENISHSEKKRKPSSVMVVNDLETAAWMSRTNCKTLIHGHTHQPGSRYIDSANGKLRVFSLGSWNPSGGVILDWPEDSDPKLRTWPFDD